MPVKLIVTEALLPPGSVCLKLILVVWFSSSWETDGESVMTCSPEETLVVWILRSVVLRDMELVSSTTSRLGRPC
jgi:hypothetical protein